MLTPHQIDTISNGKNGGMADQFGMMARKKMHALFIELIKPDPNETILDVGANTDSAYISSNYLEQAGGNLNITAVGLGHSNSTWHDLYPSIPYIHGNALNLPFDDNQFDIVYSHAVIEHVGGFDHQVMMIKEAIRVAKRAVWITTPNRWYPVEFHTLLPLIHWLPKKIHRAILKKLALHYFADETVLNLLDKKSFNLAVLKAQKMASFEKTIIKTIHQSTFLSLNANLLLQIEIKE